MFTQPTQYIIIRTIWAFCQVCVCEITASGLFDNQHRQQNCLSWLSKNPRRLFHDKPGKNPDYSLVSAQTPTR